MRRVPGDRGRLARIFSAKERAGPKSGLPDFGTPRCRNRQQPISIPRSQDRCGRQHVAAIARKRRTRRRTIAPFSGDTSLFITPGYRFRAVDALLTNFHLPRSTLFMLVAAFSGLDTMKRAYAHAVEKGYRFYSYGDACLLFRTP